MSDPSEIEAVFLDIGNVVIAADHGRFVARLAERSRSGVATAAIERAVYADGLERAFDLGLFTPDEFARRAARIADAEIDFEEFRRLWCDIFAEPDDGPTLALLRRLGKAFPLYAASNTNPLHMEYLGGAEPFPRYLAPFERIFTSYELGAAKPDFEFFRRMLEAASVRPAMAFFADDLPENVEAARAAGIRAEVFRGPEWLAERLGLAAD